MLFQAARAPSLVLVFLSLGCIRSAPPASAEKAASLPGPGSPGSGAGSSAAGPGAGPGAGSGAQAKAKSGSRPSKLQLPEWFQEVQDLYLEATQAIDQGDEKKARESLEHLLALQPEHVNASIAMAKICRKARNFEEALSVLEAALKAEPANLSLLYEKAVTQFEQGEPAAALTTLDGMLKPEIRMPSGRYLRAVILASTKDREGALAALEDALENGFDDLQRLEKEGRLTFIAQEERYFRVAERLRTRAHSAAQASGSGAERQKDDLELKLLREARESPQKSELLPRLERNLSSGQGTRIAVDLKAVDEQQLQLSSYAGKPVVIVLWGTWSGWCRKQLSEVARLRDAFQPRGLAVLSLYYELMGKRKEDIEEGVRTYLRDAKIDLPCAVIDDGFANSIEVATYPTTIFVASDGKAYLKAAGFMDYATLEALATALMKGPSPPAASPKDR